MSRTTRIIAGVIIAVIVVVLLGLAYIWVSGGSGAPSATLSAPTLVIATKAPTTAPTSAPTATTEATSAATKEATTAATPEATAATSAATSESTAAATTETSAASVASAPVVFNIATDQSQVSFTLNEVLNGSPNKVVGTTNQVAGQIAVDFANPANSQVGEIRIDARSLATDSGMRDRMIRGQVLQSSQDQYEFISFKPTAITGLPATLTMGQPVQFRMTGDLTIRDVTKPVTFDVTVTPDSTSKIEGTATATIQRDDFNLTIPRVPSVASADEAVVLQIDFVATNAV